MIQVEDANFGKFHNLCREAQSCRICPDLADKTAVLSELNGSLTPRVFFVAEAPGRQGADRTRRPFYGDKSGENFQVLLDSIGLKRDQIFITNAVMCSPRTLSDANRKPTRKEIQNCSGFLRRQIELFRPQIVTTLGGVALEALKAVEYHKLRLKTHAGFPHEWNGRILLPLYHPSPQVIAAQRGLDLQLRHFAVLKELMSTE
ncbi:MAG TPA: uracil-DNA glycosylase [Blastocatellia bacterium]|nr:uracil-DNA glycosylase [Blastocatellia bacterium]